MPRTPRRRANAPQGALEAELARQGFKFVAGVDEAGRGPLAGPVVAGAVILGPDWDEEGLDDSKKLSAGRREELALLISEKPRPGGWAGPGRTRSTASTFIGPACWPCKGRSAPCSHRPTTC